MSLLQPLGLLSDRQPELRSVFDGADEVGGGWVGDDAFSAYCA